MLNEWIETNTTLKSLGCTFEASHPNFKSCPNKRGYIVYLDKNGRVEDADVPDFEMETVFKWQKGKTDPSFPVFSGRAIYEVTCDPELIPEQVSNALRAGKSKKPTSNKTEHPLALIKDFLKFLRGCNDLWNDQQDMKLISRCMHEVSKELYQTYLKNAEPKPAGYGAYVELVKRAALCETERFKKDLRKIFWKKLLLTGKKEFAEVLFAFKKKEKKKGRGNEYGRDFQFLLSIKDWDNPEYGVDRYPPYPYKNSPLHIWMAQTFEEIGNELYKPAQIEDAFGHDLAGAQENYDDIDAAGLGQIKLFAAYDKIPCLMRYGLKSIELFPAGRTARESGRKAMEYILDRKRIGISWISLRKYENRNTVAFAYCNKLNNANAIRVFDDEDSDEKANIYISEESTKTALKALDGIAESEPAAEIFVGIVAAVDKGNTKIISSKRYPISHYLSGARRWQQGCSNIPEILLPVYEKKGHLLKGALPVYPARAIWLLNSEWRQNGQRFPGSKRFALTDALDILFERNEYIRARVDAALCNVLEKGSQALIRAKLKAALDQEKKGGKVSFANSEYLHQLPTLYGLLLHKKGIEKEVYMNDTLFNLGKYFAVLDDLYIQYHMDVRSGSVPLSLLGNDYVKLALQNPLDAYLSATSRLLHPYMTWAKRVGTEKKPGQIAKSCLRKLAALSEILSEDNLPTDIDDANKAKLLLGYLSCEAKKSNQSKMNSEEHQTEGGEEL